MKTQFSKKFLAILASAVLLVCSFAGTFVVSAEDAQVYDIDGTKYAFAAADGEVSYNGTAYGAYATFKEAYTALGGKGTIVVEGTLDMLTSNESAATDEIIVKGLGSTSSTLQLNNYQGINGSWEFYDIDLRGHDSDTTMAAGNIVFGAGTVHTNKNIWFRGAKNNGGTTVQKFMAGSGFRFELLDFDWGMEADTNLYRIFDGSMQFGWQLRIDNKAANVNNVTYAFNKAVSNDLNVNADPKGALTLIYNNGLAAGTINDANGYIDYRLNVGVGGYATLKTEATADTAPTFAITHAEGMAPAVNGVAIPLVDGEYLYTPSAKGTTDITFIDSRIYTIDGEVFVFAAADKSITYNGVDYVAYETFADAYNSVKGYGGTIVIEGTHNITSESTSAATTKAIKIVGVDMDTAILNTTASYLKIYGELTIDNLTMKSSSGDSNTNLNVDQFTIGPNAKSSGYFWFTGFNGSNGSQGRLNHFGDTKFMINMCALEWSGRGANGFQTHFGPNAYVNWDIRVNGTTNGNATYIFDSVTHHNNKKINVSTDPAGALSIILNDGTTGLTIGDANGYVDYVLKLAQGGYAAIKTEGSADTAPTFVITHKDDCVPVINGEELALTNGEYLYTPTEKGTTEITFSDPNAPQVYGIDGKNYAFAAADKKVTYNGVEYNAFETLELAYKAIMSVGGTIVIEGQHAPYTDATVTKAITIEGVDRSTSVLFFGSYWNSLNGELTLKNLTMDGGDVRRILADRLTFDNVNATAKIRFVAVRPNTTTGYINFTKGSSFDFVRLEEACTGLPDNFNNFHLLFNGGYINWDVQQTQPVYGNMTYIFNDVSMMKKQLKVTTDPTGAMTLIFNNGITGFALTDANNYTDYILNVAAGGYADIKAEGSATTAPTFVITHKEGLTPVVNGQALEAVNGEYLFTPTAKDNTITFFDPNAPKVEEIDGKNYAFAAADKKVTYNGVEYNAYETLELAYKAIMSVGGTIVIEGQHAPYTDAAVTKAITIEGVDKTTSVLYFGSYWNTLNGELTLKNLTMDGGDVRRVLADRLTFDGVKGTANIRFVSIRPNGETGYINFTKGSSFDFVRLEETTTGVADTFKNFHLIFNGAYINWDLQQNGAVYGNMTYIFNDVSMMKKQLKVTTDPTGAMTLIFNNGITGFALTDANNYTDYVLNVAKGGYATIKTEGSATAAPTFAITVPAGKKPVVDGTALVPVNGEYLFTPEETGTFAVDFVDGVKVEVLAGAAVRYGTPTGLRFITSISGLEGLAEIGATYKAYTMIAPVDYIDGEFTKEAFDAAGKAYLNIDLTVNGSYVGDGVTLPATDLYNAAIVNIKQGNYDRGFAARSYVVITYADGSTEIIYSDFSETDNVRSVKEVAEACLATGDYDNEKQKAILEGFVA